MGFKIFFLVKLSSDFLGFFLALRLQFSNKIWLILLTSHKRCHQEKTGLYFRNLCKKSDRKQVFFQKKLNNNIFALWKFNIVKSTTLRPLAAQVNVDQKISKNLRLIFSKIGPRSKTKIRIFFPIRSVATLGLKDT